MINKKPNKRYIIEIREIDLSQKGRNLRDGGKEGEVQGKWVWKGINVPYRNQLHTGMQTSCTINTYNVSPESTAHRVVKAGLDALCVGPWVPKPSGMIQSPTGHAVRSWKWNQEKTAALKGSARTGCSEEQKALSTAASSFC